MPAEFRRIAEFDLVKQYRIGRRNVVIDAFFVLFKAVFADIADLAAVGHDANFALGQFVDKVAVPHRQIRSYRSRSSVVRRAREMNDAAMIPKINNDAILMPLGCSTILTTVV